MIACGIESGREEYKMRWGFGAGRKVFARGLHCCHGCCSLIYCANLNNGVAIFLGLLFFPRLELVVRGNGRALLKSFVVSLVVGRDP